MPVDGRPPPPASGDRPQWPSRLGWALGMTALQILAAFAVFFLSLIPAVNAESGNPDDWAGFAYVIYGLIAAPFAAIAVGLLVAARARLPLPGLYALPVPLAAIALWQFQFFDVLFGFAVCAALAGNVVIALATCRLPLRPRRADRGRTGGGPV